MNADENLITLECGCTFHLKHWQNWKSIKENENKDCYNPKHQKHLQIKRGN